MQLISPRGIEPGQRKTVLRLVRGAAAESVNYTLAARRIPVLDAVPMHAVGARRNVIQFRIANQRPQFLFVQRDGLLRRFMLFGRPRGCPASG